MLNHDYYIQRHTFLQTTLRISNKPSAKRWTPTAAVKAAFLEERSPVKFVGRREAIIFF